MSIASIFPLGIGHILLAPLLKYCLDLLLRRFVRDRIRSSPEVSVTSSKTDFPSISP